MAKKLLIDATHAEETRVVVVDGNKVEDFDFESIHKRQLAGNIYLAKVTRVEPSLQAAFVDYGGNRHGFLAFAEIHPDYYQIPVADRQALLAEERALSREAEDSTGGGGNDGGNGNGARRSRRRPSRGGGGEGANRQSDTPETRDAAQKDAAQKAAPHEQAAEATPEAVLIETVPVDVTLDETPTPNEDPTEVPADRPSEAPVETPAETPAEAPAESPREAPEPPETAPLEMLNSEAPSGEAAESGGDGGSDDPSIPEAPRSGSIAARSDDSDPRSYGAMDVIDLDDDEGGEGGEDDSASNASTDEGKPYRAADHASETDDQIESVADEDVSDEVRPPRRARPRRYKIQEVIKVRQIMLVQVVKEERGNKGAALTTYLSLAGRYCVLMPNTARGGGISRKITNAADRKKLKEIASEFSVPEGAGLIIRTAGANRTKAEIKRDYEYLFRLWEQIRDLTLKSVAPAPIYEEGNLIKRAIRDLYNKDIDEVIVEGEAGYRTAKDFMKMIMPSHARNVKLYTDPMPLFARYQVESYLGSMFNPTVQLKSGGYIVIGVTEALVAIDVNSGKSTREGSIEETAVKTNLEAAEEVARQLRLRDLAGLIVIDFIDMEERKNNLAVEKRLKDALRNDRARIQVGRISGFGLLEMSRQRLRPGMIEATTQPCPHCHGTGLIRSDNSLSLQILRAIEEEGTRARSKEVLVKAPTAVVNYLFNAKREHIAQIEVRYGMAVRIEADPALVSPDYTIEKFKTATRVVTVQAPQVVSLDAGIMDDIDGEMSRVDEAEEVEVTQAESDGEDGTAEDSRGEGGKRKRRRTRRPRRRRGGGQTGVASGDVTDDTGDDEQVDSQLDGGAIPSPDAAEPVTAEPAGAESAAESGVESVAEETAKPVRKRRSRARKKAGEPSDVTGAAEGEADATPAATPAATLVESDEAPAPKKRTRARRKPKTEVAEAPVETQAETPAAAAPTAAPDTASETTAESEPESAPEDAPVTSPAPAPEPVAPEPVAPEPVAPESVAPESVAPESVAIEPVAIEPGASPVAPEAASAESPLAGTAGQETAGQETAGQGAPVPDMAPQAPALAPVSAEPQPEKPAAPRRKGWWSRKS